MHFSNTFIGSNDVDLYKLQCILSENQLKFSQIYNLWVLATKIIGPFMRTLIETKMLNDLQMATVRIKVTRNQSQ